MLDRTRITLYLWILSVAFIVTSIVGQHFYRRARALQVQADLLDQYILKGFWLRREGLNLELHCDDPSKFLTAIMGANHTLIVACEAPAIEQPVWPEPEQPHYEFKPVCSYSCIMDPKQLQKSAH